MNSSSLKSINPAYPLADANIKKLEENGEMELIENKIIEEKNSEFLLEKYFTPIISMDGIKCSKKDKNIIDK